jgi:hypothetical protein
MMKIEPFKINVRQSEIDARRKRRANQCGKWLDRPGLRSHIQLSHPIQSLSDR